MSDKDYRLEVELSSQKAMTTLDQLTKKLNDLNAAGNKADSTMNRLGGTSSTAAKGFHLLQQGSNNAGEGILRLNKSSGDLNSNLLMLTKSLVSYEIAARAIAAADDYNNMNNRLKLVTDSQAELNTALKDTFEISQTTGTIWSSTVQIYQRFLDISDDVGKSQAEIGRITETVSKSIAMSGATVESANAAIIQFSQGMASGVLRGQEFNSVAEQTPALLDAIAFGLNKSRGELRAMANDGQLTSEVVLGALEKSGAHVDEMFGRMTLGVSATFNKLRNETTRWIGEMNEASGATSVLNGLINMLAENLDGAAFIAGTAALATLTKTVIASTTAATQRVVTSTAERAAIIAEMEAVAANTSMLANETRAKVAAMEASVAEAQARVRNATTTIAEEKAKAVLTARQAQLATATAANTAATAAETIATNTLATATSRLAVAKQAALGLFGGGAGLIAMGLAAAAMYLLMRDTTSESTKAAEAHAKYVDMDREALEKLTKAQAAAAIDTLTDSMKAQNDELKVMDSRFEAVVNRIASGFASKGMTTQADEVRSILAQLREGTLDYGTAIEMLNEKQLLTSEQRTQLFTAQAEYRTIFDRAMDAARALGVLGKEVKLQGNEATNAKWKNDSYNDSLDETETKAKKAAKAVQDYNNDVLKSIKQNAYTMQRSKTTNFEQAKKEGEFYAKTGQAPNLEMQKAIAAELEWAKSVSSREEAIKKAEKEREKAAKDAEKYQEKLQKEMERSRDQRQDDYNSFIEDTRTEIQEIGDEFQKFLMLYNEFGGGNQEVFNQVKAKYDELAANAKVDLDQYMNQFSSYWNTAADDANDYYKQQEFLLRFSTKVTKEERDKMRADLMSAWQNELNLITVQEEIKRLEAKKTFMDQKAYILELAELRQKEINYTPDLTEDMKNYRSDAVQADAQSQINQMNQEKLSSYFDVMKSVGAYNPQEELMLQLDNQRAIIQDAYREQLLDKETHDQAMRAVDENYWQASNQMWAAMWGSSLDSWGGFFQNVLGENSEGYRALFALQKSFSIASAALNIQKAIADGWGQGATIQEKAAAVATIISNTGQIVSDMSSIVLGFKDGGYTGSIGKNNIAGVVHGNEFVMPAEETAKYRNQLESMRKGTFGAETQAGIGTLQINNYITMGEDGRVTATTEGDTRAYADGLNAAIVAVIQKQLEQGGIIDRKIKGGAV